VADEQCWAAENTEERGFVYDMVEAAYEESEVGVVQTAADVFPDDVQDYVNLVGQQQRRRDFLKRLYHKLGGK
jgi:hypothetical protein